MYLYKVALKIIFVLFLLSLTCSGKRRKRTGKSKNGAPTVRISINTKNIVFETNQLSPSVAIDSSVFDYNLLPLFNDSRLIKLANELGSSILRIGGTKQDITTFDLSGAYEKPIEEFKEQQLNSDWEYIKNVTVERAKAEAENFTNNLQLVNIGWENAAEPIVLTGPDWDRLNSFCKAANWRLLFGLNLLLRNGTNWDSSNAQQVIKYSEHRKYSLDWQLGNEPNSFNHKFGVKLLPEQIGKDFKQLSSILRQNSYWDDSLIVGPDSNRMYKKGSRNFLKTFINAANESIQTASFHQYYLNGRIATVKDFLNKTVMDTLHSLLRNVKQARRKSEHKTIPLWLSETSSAYGGGSENLTDSFANGFLWLDKLGTSARSGIDLVVRQTFYWGHYALLDTDFTPRPDYWLTLLYKRLVGRKVLKTGFSSSKRHESYNSNLRVYAHCAKIKRENNGNGKVAVYFLNLDESSQRIKFTRKGFDVSANLYLLQGGSDGNVLSKTVKLNGKELEMKDYTTLPELNSVFVRADEIKRGLSVPGHSMGFIILNTDFKVCK